MMPAVTQQVYILEALYTRLLSDCGHHQFHTTLTTLLASSHHPSSTTLLALLALLSRDDSSDASRDHFNLKFARIPRKQRCGSFILFHHYALPYNFTRFTLKVEPTALIYHLLRNSRLVRSFCFLLNYLP